MKYFSALKATLLFGILSLVIGCKSGSDQAASPKEVPTTVISNDSTKILVVNEGLFQRNNSTLTLIQPKTNTSTTDLFVQKTGLELGDTGNDVAIYGGKIYIVVNVSSNVTVLDANSYRLLRQINLFIGVRTKQPRQIAFYKGRAFVSCFDGTIVAIDTATLNTEFILSAGRNPDGICVTGDYLITANSGGLSAPNFDNTLTVYDLRTLSIVGNIIVDANPTSVYAGQAGEAYVYAQPDFTSNTAYWTRVDAARLRVMSRRTIPNCITATAGQDTLIQIRNGKTPNPELVYVATNTDQETIIAFPILKNIKTPYSLMYNKPAHELWVGDSKDYVTSGQVWRFNHLGQLIKTYPTGLNPGAMITLPN